MPVHLHNLISLHSALHGLTRTRGIYKWTAKTDLTVPMRRLIWINTKHTNEPPHDKTKKISFVSSEDSDQPGYPPKSDQSLCCPHDDSWGPWLSVQRTVKADQTGQMPRLIWILAGCTGHFVGFVMRWLKSFLRFGSTPSVSSIKKSWSGADLRLTARTIGIYSVYLQMSQPMRLWSSVNSVFKNACGARCLLPYFMFVNSDGSGRLCDKYHNLTSWLICTRSPASI